MAKTRKNKNVALFGDLQPKYDRAAALDPIRLECYRGKCRSTEKLTHCPECAEYLDLRRALDAALGLKPWHTLPIEPDMTVEEARQIALEDAPQ